MHYARPIREEDVQALLKEGGWDILAGGTDYYPGLRDGVARGKLLDITAVDAYRKIGFGDGFWSIGATATWSDVIAADLPAAFGGLKSAAREVGSIQIQNRATIAGNLCNASPAADGVPPLLTLDAEVELLSVSGARRLPVGAFITGNRRTELRDGEIVTRILVPEASAGGTSAFRKLGARTYLVISISMVAARIELDGGGRIKHAAVSVGACSAVAQRLSALENAVIGAPADDGLANLVSGDHLSVLTPIDDVRAPARYRMDASLELVRRTVVDAARGGL